MNFKTSIFFIFAFFIFLYSCNRKTVQQTDPSEPFAPGKGRPVTVIGEPDWEFRQNLVGYRRIGHVFIHSSEGTISCPQFADEKNENLILFVDGKLDGLHGIGIVNKCGGSKPYNFERNAEGEILQHCIETGNKEKVEIIEEYKKKN